MTLYKQRGAKLLLSVALVLALIFALIPAMSTEEAHAAAGDITIEFRTGDTVTSTKTITKAELEAMASGSVSAENYLLWDGAKYQALNSNSGVSILDLIERTNLPSGWSLEVTNGTKTKSFGYQDIHNGNFYGDSTATTGIDTNATSNTAIISLGTGRTDISGTAATTTVSSHDETDLCLLIGLPAKSGKDNRPYEAYIKEENTDDRYISGVTKISVVKPAAISSFNVYTQIGDSGTKTLAKTFNADELNALAHTDTRAFLQSGTTWSVHATNKYIPTSELLAAAGVVFNEGDKLVPAAGDGFSTTQTYEELLANKYFYPGTTGTANDVTNPTEVGSVLALDWIGGIGITGTAQQDVGQIDWSSSMGSGRFYMGVSEENYLAKAAAGNRLVTAPVEMTIIKDQADPDPETEATANNGGGTSDPDDQSDKSSDKEENGADGVQTGDDFNPALYAGLIMAALILGTLAISKRKKS